MSKKLETKRKELSTKVDELQVAAAERTFDIKFEDRKMIKTLMEHLNKGYSWKTSNAAVIVTLYDQLKTQTSIHISPLLKLKEIIF